MAGQFNATLEFSIELKKMREGWYANITQFTGDPRMSTRTVTTGITKTLFELTDKVIPGKLLRMRITP